MTDTLGIIFGLAVLIGICWACYRAGLLEKPPVDRREDRPADDAAIDSIRGGLRPSVDGETVARSTDFGGLDGHPKMRAGSAWGRDL